MEPRHIAKVRKKRYSVTFCFAMAGDLDKQRAGPGWRRRARGGAAAAERGKSGGAEKEKRQLATNILVILVFGKKLQEGESVSGGRLNSGLVIVVVRVGLSASY